jgi:hypothetical protein
MPPTRRSAPASARRPAGRRICRSKDADDVGATLHLAALARDRMGRGGSGRRPRTDLEHGPRKVSDAPSRPSAQRSVSTAPPASRIVASPAHRRPRRADRSRKMAAVVGNLDAEVKRRTSTPPAEASNTCRFDRREVWKDREITRSDGAQGRSRTADTRIFNPLLYQLSYLGSVARTVAVQTGSGGVIVGGRGACPEPWCR